VAAILAVTLASVGAYFYYFRSVPSSPSVSIGREPGVSIAPTGLDVVTSPLSLSASYSGRQITITWDAKLRVVSNAKIGILTIRDGDTQKEIPLTRVQLQASKIIYTPVTDQLDIALEIFSPEGKATREAVILLNSSAAPVRMAAAPPTLVPTTPASSARVSSTPALTTPARSAENSSEALTASSASTGQSQIRQFTPPAVTDKNNAPEPRVTENTSMPNISPAPSSLVAQNSVSPALIQPPQISLPRMSEPQPLPISEKLPPTVSVYPPQPIRNVKPVLPASMHVLLKRRITVQIRVRIDENGKVIQADPVATPHGVTEYLTKAALDAARGWKFQPARRGTTPIPSDYVLEFAFGPS